MPSSRILKAGLELCNCFSAKHSEIRNLCRAHRAARRLTRLGRKLQHEDTPRPGPPIAA